jgi:hypothetical protein
MSGLSELADQLRDALSSDWLVVGHGITPNRDRLVQIARQVLVVLDAEATALDPVTAILSEIGAERDAQDAKWGAPHDVPDGTGPSAVLPFRVNDHNWVPYGVLRRRAQEATDRAMAERDSTMALVLLEEVFEAVAEANQARLRTELIQVAAVAAKWVQIIDARAVRS